MHSLKPANYKDLFDLSDPLANRPLRLEPQQQWMSNERAWQLLKGEWQPPEPVLLKAYMGGQVTDILWSGQGSTTCISDKVLNLLKTNKFTGWAVYPIEVLGRKGVHLPGYHGLAVTSSAGETDYTRSKIVYKPPVPGDEVRKFYRGIFFDESKWDGSDFFRLTGSWIVVTKSVRDVFKQAKISNVRFTPLTEVEISASLFEK